VLWFGPQIVGLIGRVFKRHWILVLFVVLAIVGVGIVQWARGRTGEMEVSE